MNKTENVKAILKEIKNWLKFLFTIKTISLIIPSLIGIGIIYIGENQGWSFLKKKEYHEALAIGLMSMVVIATSTSLLLKRKYVDIMFFAVSAAFLCREIHFYGTHKGVYIAVLAVAVWAFFKQKEIFKEFNQNIILKRVWTGTMLAYFITLLIQRRAFRHILPAESDLHIYLEEITENIAHLFFYFTALISISINKIKESK